jgi:lysophospholipid acyltransferase
MVFFAALDAAQAALDINRGELFFLLNLLLAYPLALVHRRLTSSPRQRHFLSLFVGVAYGLMVFGVDSLHFLLTSLFAFLALRFLPREGVVFGVTVKAHIVVYVVTMCYLFVGHIYTTYFHYMEFALNWTASQMMLTIKLTGSAYDYYDGTGKDLSKLDSEERERIVTKLPSLLEWLSYCFFFPTLLVGPPCGLAEYLSFTDRSMFKNEPGGKIPSCVTWNGIGRKLAMALVALSYHFLHAKYNVLYATTPQFLNHSFFYRVFYVVLTTELSFEHYYFGWSNAEGACAVAGLAYNGRDEKGNVKWDRVDMVWIWTMRWAQNGAVVGRAWNVLGARWLRNTVYNRLADRSSSTFRRNAAQFATFLVSAFWHGFYPGFYLSFLSFGYLNIASQMATKLLRPIFISADGKRVSRFKPAYDFVTWFATQTCFYYCANPFKMFSVQNVLATWGAIYYCFHVGGTILIVFYMLFGDQLRRLHIDRRGGVAVSEKKQK